MAATKTKFPFEDVGELLERLGGIPPERICLNPPPGTATKDRVLLSKHGRPRKLYELVENTLVEKPMGSPRSIRCPRTRFLATKLRDRTRPRVLHGR